MYSLFCLLEGDYIKQYKFDMVNIRYTNFYTPQQTSEVDLIGSKETIVKPTDTYRHVNIRLINFEVSHPKTLHKFIHTWFDNRGFLGATNLISKAPFECANPESFLYLPFEAFEIHFNGKPETVSLREFYSRRF